MPKDTILKDATPRPWHVGMRPGPIVYGPRGEQVVDLRANMLPAGENKANAQLLLTAANAYEHHLAVIQELVSACEALEYEASRTIHDNDGSGLQQAVWKARNAINHAKEQ